MVTLWSISGRTLRTGWSLYACPVSGSNVPSEPRRQLHGAVQGLKYLHDASLTHGDLKGVRAWPLPDVSTVF